MLTRPTTVLITVLALALLATAFASCNEGDEPDGDVPAAKQAAPPAAKPPAADDSAGGDSTPAATDGRDVYVRANCTMCHGDDLSGSTLAPALENLEAHWTVDTLEQYLEDPVGYAESDERLSGQIKQYTTMKMPAWSTTGLSDGDRDALIAWLLEQ